MSDGRVLQGGEAGVTLVELMIVLVVIAIGVLALSGIQTRSSTDVYSTGRRTRALALAESQMEVARGLGYDSAVADSGQSNEFAWRTAVDSADVALHRVTVTVNWTENGAARSVQLINLLSQR